MVETPIDGAPPAITQTSALVSVHHTARNMKMYSVTESELNTLSVINGMMAVLVGLGSGIIGYGLDLHKDLLLTIPIPEKALILKSLIEPLTFKVGIGFYALAVVSWFWRRSVLAIMKQESANQKGKTRRWSLFPRSEVG